MKSTRYIMKFHKYELGVVINALNIQRKKLLNNSESTTSTDILLLRLIDVYEGMK